MLEKKWKRDCNKEYISNRQSNFINAAEFEKYLKELGIPVNDDAERAKFVLNEMIATKVKGCIKKAKQIADEKNIDFGAGSIAIAAASNNKELE